MLLSSWIRRQANASILKSFQNILIKSGWVWMQKFLNSTQLSRFTTIFSTVRLIFVLWRWVFFYFKVFYVLFYVPYIAVDVERFLLYLPKISITKIFDVILFAVFWNPICWVKQSMYMSLEKSMLLASVVPKCTTLSRKISFLGGLFLWFPIATFMKEIRTSISDGIFTKKRMLFYHGKVLIVSLFQFRFFFYNFLIFLA